VCVKGIKDGVETTSRMLYWMVKMYNTTPPSLGALVHPNDRKAGAGKDVQNKEGKIGDAKV
jgi:hypothetical protein